MSMSHNTPENTQHSQIKQLYTNITSRTHKKRKNSWAPPHQMWEENTPRMLAERVQLHQYPHSPGCSFENHTGTRNSPVHRINNPIQEHKWHLHIWYELWKSLTSVFIDVLGDKSSLQSTDTGTSVGLHVFLLPICVASTSEKYYPGIFPFQGVCIPSCSWYWPSFLWDEPSRVDVDSYRCSWSTLCGPPFR